MLVGTGFMRDVFSRFGRDDRGTISTEWAVAIAIVVSMAVPVMAFISDGSETSSEDMVVSIRDTDSFGGEGFQPGGGGAAVHLGGDELYVPGADLGIGFPPEGAQDTVRRSASAERSGHFSYSGAGIGTVVRRDKDDRAGTAGLATLPIVSAGASRSSSTNAPIRTAESDRSRVPAGEGERLGYGQEHCIEPIRAEAEPEHTSYVVASGR